MVTETVYRVKCVVCVKTPVTVVWLGVGQMKHLVLISVVGCCWSDVSVCLLESLLGAEETDDVCEMMETSCVVNSVSVLLLKHQVSSEYVFLATWTQHHFDVHAVLEETVSCQMMSS